jgi:hypothetical protein
MKCSPIVRIKHSKRRLHSLSAIAAHRPSNDSTSIMQQGTLQLKRTTQKLHVNYPVVKYTFDYSIQASKVVI